MATVISKYATSGTKDDGPLDLGGGGGGGGRGGTALQR